MYPKYEGSSLRPPTDGYTGFEFLADIIEKRRQEKTAKRAFAAAKKNLEQGIAPTVDTLLKTKTGSTHERVLTGGVRVKVHEAQSEHHFAPGLTHIYLHFPSQAGSEEERELIVSLSLVRGKPSFNTIYNGRFELISERDAQTPLLTEALGAFNLANEQLP